MNRHVGQRAVVIGAGVGGLSAAGALSSYFENVVVLERDSLPSSATSRSGAPQDRHAHLILAGGLNALSQLFPGFAKDLADAGAVPVNAFQDIQYERPDVGVLPRRDCGLSMLCCSRPLIEQVLRQRVAAFGNLTLQSQCRVTDIVPGTNPLSVRFVDSAGHATAIAADLVIDASGRGAPTLALLEALGAERPPETAVGVDIGYTTACLPQPSAAAINAKILYTLPDPPGLTLGGLLMPIENGQCLVTLSTRCSSRQPQSWPDFLAALRRLRTPAIYNAVRDLPPPTALKHYLLEESRWRHFERLPRLPRGLLPVADSLCRFNPVYGQGMTVAALQAKLLHDTLARMAEERDPIIALQTDFMANVAPLLQAPWILGVNADFAFPGTRGQRPEQYEESRRFEAALFRAAVADPVVQRALCEVMQLVKPFELLDSPDIQRRIKAAAEAVTVPG